MGGGAMGGGAMGGVMGAMGSLGAIGPMGCSLSATANPVAGCLAAGVMGGGAMGGGAMGGGAMGGGAMGMIGGRTGMVPAGGSEGGGAGPDGTQKMKKWACSECHKAKTACEGNPCRRCQRLGKTCIAQERPQRKRRGGDLDDPALVLGDDGSFSGGLDSVHIPMMPQPPTMPVPQAWG